MQQHRPACASHPSVEDFARRVLIVSSAAQDRQTLMQFLEPHGCLRCWASTVREASEWLNGNSAQIIICDDKLPDGRWQELWEKVRRQPDAPVFIVSASWMDARLWAEVLNLGAWDVIVRPYQKSEVSRVLQHVCRRLEFFA